ncbi:cyclin-like protein [Cutaneotrichosporon oleaginosum]|uniref:Cyclin-like protein n=1 Tax=Cutaneotrichosporon oleaginosum TaxID=879819 RepID=A0A0J0XN34_9TREE|nr:cyclin-like protein [Cutaneotrichosporon oleaginosum]KLT42525.1 cyclin-like protein [Cutaneotrichosporon oleaginosum]TXT07797.1 hypothetical protein COLE_04721 [Cutaneotrichosporon oleaginosum]
MLEPHPPTPAPSRPRPGLTAYHESSQFKHWRYSKAGLDKLRHELNEKSKEVTDRNVAAEKAAQESLGHTSSLPTPAYLSVDDELLLVRFYCSHASTICRQGFGSPEEVEATAISYIKRFYLKNSVMEWHPKVIMPTCLYLAAKTTNHNIPIKDFVKKFEKFKADDVLDLEFLVAQSLSFEFWVRGAERALRGWALELQSSPVSGAGERAQRALPKALRALAASRMTDAEFLFAPAQIALACWRIADRELTDAFLEAKYDGAEEGKLPFGIAQDALLGISGDLETMIRAGEAQQDLKKVKEVDKRLKSCANPEKVPGTALYIQRKAEREAKAAEERKEKQDKIARAREADEMVFGGDLKLPQHKDDPF